ncbi:hypothetical protein EVAR_3212_1 [Eumeta japonica]|uniref:Uncharacterized protein n=1 Tax=Eumeta variegata TaxID=151549 RepID=A0A4C1SY41_EUMVA|nr:hypothetical protein EVAR_3212_1 [Eumeta japonica]
MFISRSCVKYFNVQIQRTKFSCSELAAYDILRRYYAPRPFLLRRRVPILRHCDAFLTNFTEAKYLRNPGRVRPAADRERAERPPRKPRRRDTLRIRHPHFSRSAALKRPSVAIVTTQEADNGAPGRPERLDPPSGELRPRRCSARSRRGAFCSAPAQASFGSATRIRHVYIND